jgi:hypothetical protein
LVQRDPLPFHRLVVRYVRRICYEHVAHARYSVQKCYGLCDAWFPPQGAE